MKACLQWAPSNPLPFCIFYSAVILGTEFFNSNPVMHLCSHAWQYVLIFGCRLFIHPDHQLISKIRLPTFPIRPDHPTNLSKGDERLPFSSPAAICRVIYLVPVMNVQASFAHLQLKCIDGPIIQCAGQMRPPGVFWEISQGGGRMHERGKELGNEVSHHWATWRAISPSIPPFILDWLSKSARREQEKEGEEGGRIMEGTFFSILKH